MGLCAHLTSRDRLWSGRILCAGFMHSVINTVSSDVQLLCCDPKTLFPYSALLTLALRIFHLSLGIQMPVHGSEYSTVFKFFIP